ncbi:MAG: AsmA-like C-terminal domain-containing protein [Pseudomonadota bacterium]
MSNAGETTVAPLIEGAPRETIDLAFRFRNLESSYLAEMTPITGGAGSATLDATRFDLTVESAQVDLGEAGALELGGSRFAIPDFAPRIPPSEIEIRSRGPIRALLALIDQEPLGFPSKLGLDPATARGEVDGVTRLALPLAKDLPMDAVSIAADGALTKISLPVAQLEGARASAETAELEVDAEGLRLRAEARLEGIEEHLVWVDWRERFAPEAGEARTRLAIASTITAAEFDAMGAPPEFGLSGSARLTGGLDVVDDQPIAIRAALRLDRLGFTDPYLGWSKTAGQEARIEASGRFDSESAGWRLDRLTAAGPGLAATGAARLAADGAFRSLSLASLTVDDRIDASINLTRDAEGISINGRGAKFDVSELLGASASSADAASGDEAQSDEAARASAAQAEEPRLALDLAFDRVTLGEGAELTAMRLAASRSPSGRLYADLTATAGEGVVSASVRPIDDSPRRRYRLETNNLGQLLQASGQINAAERGAAVITAEERADGAVKGDLTARGLVVRDAPVLADILSIASVVGIFDLASSGGITFTQINGPFTYREGVLTLGEMAAVGPSLGLTLEGTVDFRRDQLDLDGSVTPAFVINGLPGQVPIIGDLLTGGEGQGVLGVSFTMRGPIEDFKVSVDPLSAVMPGPLRRLRRLFTD